MNLGVQIPMYRNHCLFGKMFNGYKSSLFSNINEKFFPYV